MCPPVGKLSCPLAHVVVLHGRNARHRNTSQMVDDSFSHLTNFGSLMHVIAALINNILWHAKHCLNVAYMVLAVFSGVFWCKLVTPFELNGC